MKLPPGYTEPQVTDILIMISNRLASKFTFGSYTIEDIKQEVFVIALTPDTHGVSCIEKYKPETGPLENFLYIHVRNRLSNLKRDKFQRLNKPCYKCPLKAYLGDTDECTAFADKSECGWWANWSTKNNSKKNLLSPVSLDSTDDENEEGMKTRSEPIEALESKEFTQLIDDNLPAVYRHDYNRMLAGIKIPRCRKKKIKEIIRDILEDSYDG